MELDIDDYKAETLLKVLWIALNWIRNIPHNSSSWKYEQKCKRKGQLILIMNEMQYEKETAVQEEHMASSSEPSFVIFAKEHIGYAIPIQNVLEFTFLPESSMGTSVVVDGESIPCIPINNRVSGMPENRVCCVLCKDSQGAKIMLSFGHQAEYEYHRFLIKTLPQLKDISVKDSAMESLCDVVKSYETPKCNGYQFCVLVFR